MHLDTLTEPEQRVLGCLIEKRFTTPDQYPLTLNALRLACNQSTNRDPVVAYDEETVNAAAQRLTRYGVVRLASGHSSRATKYRHLAEEALGLGHEELALLAVLLLRGPQTPGELKSRSDRLVAFASLEALEEVLGRLVARGYVAALARRPGQKEERYIHTLGAGADSVAPVPERASTLSPADPPPTVSSLAPRPQPSVVAPDATRELEARLERLEARVAQIAGLLEELTGEQLTGA